MSSILTREKALALGTELEILSTSQVQYLQSTKSSLGNPLEIHALHIKQHTIHTYITILDFY
jgi:hypothetical protein